MTSVYWHVSIFFRKREIYDCFSNKVLYNNRSNKTKYLDVEPHSLDWDLSCTHIYKICRRVQVWSLRGICRRRRCAADWSPRTSTHIRNPLLLVWRIRYRDRTSSRDTQLCRTQDDGLARRTSRPLRSFGCCSKRDHLTTKYTRFFYVYHYTIFYFRKQIKTNFFFWF